MIFLLFQQTLEDAASATQNMNFLLNAFDLDESTTQVEKLDNEVNADGDGDKHDDADNEWEDMCEYLTQRRVSLVVDDGDDDDEETPNPVTNHVSSQTNDK
jgi:hypothetical protein